jgi:hypothetical protein
MLRLLWFADQLATKPVSSVEIQTTAKLESWIADASTPISQAVKQNMERTLDVYLALSLHPKHAAIFQSTSVLSPVEFHCIGVLLMVHKDTLGIKKILEGIQGVRILIGSKEAKRFRKDFLTASYSYISKMKPSGPSTPISKDADLMQHAQVKNLPNSNRFTTSPSISSSAKRKREDDSDSDAPLMSKVSRTSTELKQEESRTSVTPRPSISRTQTATPTSVSEPKLNVQIPDSNIHPPPNPILQPPSTNSFRERLKSMNAFDQIPSSSERRRPTGKIQFK